MRLTAIIPTHNRAISLGECLRSLEAQDVDASAFEVLVIDDGSDSPADIESVANKAARQGVIQIRCEHIPPSGLNEARNLGAELATGDVLAFLDDDTLVSPGWAAALLRTFEQESCAAVGGRVELRLEGPAPGWLSSRRYYLAEYDFGPEPRWLTGELIDGRDSFPVGANCAVRRADFNALGGFRGGLDRIGKSLVSNGDTEFFRRVHAAGGKLRYEPLASVVHCVPADRLTVRFFVKRHYAQGLSDELLLLLERRRLSLGRLVYLLRMTSQAAARLAVDVVRGRSAINGVFEVSFWAGHLAAARVRPQPARTTPAASFGDPGS